MFVGVLAVATSYLYSCLLGISYPASPSAETTLLTTLVLRARAMLFFVQENKGWAPDPSIIGWPAMTLMCWHKIFSSLEIWLRKSGQMRQLSVGSETERSWIEKRWRRHGGPCVSQSCGKEERLDKKLWGRDERKIYQREERAIPVQSSRVTLVFHQDSEFSLS